MKEIDKIIQILNNHLPEIQKKYQVNEMGVFGSYVREENNKDIDIDILVSFQEPVSIDLFDFIHLKDELKALLGKKVDLVMKSGLKKRIGEQILKEVIYIR